MEWNLDPGSPQPALRVEFQGRKGFPGLAINLTLTPHRPPAVKVHENLEHIKKALVWKLTSLTTPFPACKSFPGQDWPSHPSPLQTLIFSTSVLLLLQILFLKQGLFLAPRPSLRFCLAPPWFRGIPNSRHRQAPTDMIWCGAQRQHSPHPGEGKRKANIHGFGCPLFDNLESH